MDIALKQRMVGASVLIALGVIFIPMVLEGPGSNGTQSVDLDIPPRNSRVLPVGDARPEPAEPVVERPVPNVARSDAEDARSDEPEPESTDPAPAGINRTVAAEVESKPAAGSEGAASEPEVPAAEDTAPAEPVTTRPEPVADTTAASPSTDSADIWAVQVGSFRRQASAVDLTAQLLAADFPAYLESLTVRDAQLYRIRVGPLENQTRAETVATQIKGRLPSLSPAVLSPDKVTSGATLMSTWSLQLGSFRDRTNADALRDRVRASGHAAYIRIVGSSFRVLVGPELDRASIDGVRSEIDREFGIRGIVVST